MAVWQCECIKLCIESGVGDRSIAADAAEPWCLLLEGNWGKAEAIGQGVSGFHWAVSCGRGSLESGKIEWRLAERSEGPRSIETMRRGRMDVRAVRKCKQTQGGGDPWATDKA